MSESEQTEAQSPPPGDDPFLQDPQVEPMRGAPKCLGLFVIMAIVYFFNLYCTILVLPQVEANFTAANPEIKIDSQQNAFLSVSHRLAEDRVLGYLPVLVIMALGILSLVTRKWSLFSGIFFTGIVLQFLLFLYGWVIFALPLIRQAGDTAG